MRRLEVPIGTRFGRLTVVGEAEPAILPSGLAVRTLACRCTCGEAVEVFMKHLRSGATQSCGCLRAELSRERATTHGQAESGGFSHNYKLWRGLMQRSVTGTASSAQYYIGRGISLYKAWEEFSVFDCWMRDNLGPCPEGCSLDRINNDGNYEPGNLRWATREQQGCNKRNNKLITYGGETLTISQWGRKLGFSEGTLRNRLVVYGWPAERALTTPARKLTHART